MEGFTNEAIWAWYAIKNILNYFLLVVGLLGFPLLLESLSVIGIFSKNSQKGETFSGDQFAKQGGASSGGNWKGAAQKWRRGCLLEKVPTPVFNLVHFMHTAGPNCAVLIGWYSCKWGYICKWGYNFWGSGWTGYVSVHWWKDETRNFLVEVDSGSINKQGHSSTTGWKLSLWLFLKCRECERPLSATATRLRLWIWAQLTMRGPFGQIHFSSGFTASF